MTQLPPTLSHELADYETWDPTATQTTADLRGERHDRAICGAIVDGVVCQTPADECDDHCGTETVAGEVCARDPETCRYHAEG